MRRPLSMALTGITLGAALMAQPAQAQSPLDVLVEWNRILQSTVASTPTPTIFFTRPYSHDQHRGVRRVELHRSRLSALRRRTWSRRPPPRGRPPSRRRLMMCWLRSTRASGRPSTPLLPPHWVGSAAQRSAKARAWAPRRLGPSSTRGPTTAGIVSQPPYLLPTCQAFTRSRRLRTRRSPLRTIRTSSRSSSATTSFLSAPPPALTSEHYATDFNEVKALGGVTSTVRTAEQTSIAQRWAAIGTSTQFQHSGAIFWPTWRGVRV